MSNLRITNKMLSGTFLSDLRNNLQNMQTIQQQMSTGVIVNKASDDPLRASKVMELNTQLAQNAQYKTNIDNSTNWLSTTDSSLGQIGTVLSRIKDLVSSAGNASYGPDERASNKAEINADIGQLSQLLNNSYEGQYIFAGTAGTQKPTITKTDSSGNVQLGYLDSDGTTLISDTTVLTSAQTKQVNKIKSDLSVDISQGVSLNYNVSAASVIEFKNSTGATKDLRTILSSITSDFDSGNTDALIKNDLNDITDAVNNVSQLRGKVGAIENRMSSAKDQNTTEKTNLTEILTNTDDVDMTQATIQYSTAQTVYLAALQTSAKILQPSLIDYLR